MDAMEENWKLLNYSEKVNWIYLPSFSTQKLLWLNDHFIHFLIFIDFPQNVKTIWFLLILHIPLSLCEVCAFLSPQKPEPAQCLVRSQSCLFGCGRLYLCVCLAVCLWVCLWVAVLLCICESICVGLSLSLWVTCILDLWWGEVVGSLIIRYSRLLTALVRFFRANRIQVKP